jgi:hypothetical protein
MKRKTLDSIQSLIDSARLNCNRSNDIALIVLEERKRPPYLSADEIETVTDALTDAKIQIEEALEMLNA